MQINEIDSFLYHFTTISELDLIIQSDRLGKDKISFSSDPMHDFRKYAEATIVVPKSSIQSFQISKGDGRKMFKNVLQDEQEYISPPLYPAHEYISQIWINTKPYNRKKSTDWSEIAMYVISYTQRYHIELLEFPFY